MNADEREQLANGLLACLGDSFCELLTGPDGTAWARQFLKGECAFLVERHGVTVLGPADLGDRLEQEVRGDE